MGCRARPARKTIIVDLKLLQNHAFPGQKTVERDYLLYVRHSLVCALSDLPTRQIVYLAQRTR